MKTTYFLTVLVLILTAIPALVNASDRNGQLGIRAGFNMNKLHINDLWPADTDMREGFGAGLTVRFSHL